MIYAHSIRPVHGGNIAWAAKVAGVSPGSLLDFSASINPLGPPKSVLQALQKAFGGLQHYPDPSYGLLREALGHHHRVDPDWILPGNGAAELLTWAVRDICAPSRTNPLPKAAAVGLLTPAFGDYHRAIEAFDGNLKPVSCLPEDWGTGAQPLPLSLLQMNGEVQGYLVNNPHNPTGYLFQAESLLPLVESGHLVVLDEAFMDFIPPGQAQSLIPWVKQFPNLVILRSLTKFYSLPGLRIGYAIAHPERLQRWQRWRDPWPVNTLAEAATLAALQDQAFQLQTWQWLPSVRQALLDGLRTIAGLYPCAGAANFLLVRADRAVPELQERLLKGHHILVRDCLSFPELGDRYFRIAVRTEVENQSLLNALRDVVGE